MLERKPRFFFEFKDGEKPVLFVPYFFRELLGFLDKEVFRGCLWNLYLDMFGTLFKRLASGRAEGGASQMR